MQDKPSRMLAPEEPGTPWQQAGPASMQPMTRRDPCKLSGDSFRLGRVGGSRIPVARLAKRRCHALEGDRIENPVEKPSKPFNENVRHAHGRITPATEPHHSLISAPRRRLPTGQGMSGGIFRLTACRVLVCARAVGGAKKCRAEGWKGRPSMHTNHFRDNGARAV